MAEGRDLSIALNESKLRLSPIEEHIVLRKMNELEKRIDESFEYKKKVRSLYEFSGFEY